MSALRTVASGLGFPESPRWHAERLWFSDMALRTIFTLVEGGTPEPVAEVAGRPSGLGWLPDGRLLLVSMEDRRLLRLDGPEAPLVEVAPLDRFATWHCNDMVVDAQGRAYVGNFGFNFRGGEPPRGTVLVRVDLDGSVHAAAGDLLFPNGMALTADGRMLIVAETWASRLTRFAVATDGALSDRRVFAALPSLYPDGICLDAEGAVWAASATTGEVLRVKEGGEVLARVPTGRPGAFACMLGGEDRRTLYICAADTSVHDEAERQRAGLILALDVEVPGAGRP